MTEGYLSWKRAAIWPRFEIGSGKGYLSNLLAVILGLILVAGIWGAATVAFKDFLSAIRLILILYALGGAALWSRVMVMRWWETFIHTHPRTARAVDALTLVFAWQARVLLVENRPKTDPFGLADIAAILLFGSYLAQALAQEGVISWKIGTPILVAMSLISLGVGIYLARKKLREE